MKAAGSGRARACAGAALVATVSLTTIPAVAEPQASVGVTGGVGVRDLAHDAKAIGHLGLRADLMLLRGRNKEAAIGPYVEGASLAFSDWEAGAGASVLIPGFTEVAWVLSAGGFARLASHVEPGIAGQLFFGIRSHNFHSAYGLANGLFVDLRSELGGTKRTDLLFGARVDLGVLALPFILMWNAAFR